MSKKAPAKTKTPVEAIPNETTTIASVEAVETHESAEVIDTQGTQNVSPEEELVDLSFEKAIESGQALIAAGKSKVEAAMAIYVAIETESQERIVEAFIKGANLTPKGALTYWYNCRRKLKKQRLASNGK